MGPKGQNLTFWAFTPSGFINIFSIQKYVIFVFSMHITFSMSIFVLYICEVYMEFFSRDVKTRWECIFYIPISLYVPIIKVITCHSTHFVRSSFSKGIYLYIWKTMLKKSCTVCFKFYSYVDNGHHRVLLSCNFTQ